MALEIKPPPPEQVSRLGVAGALVQMWPQFFALALSFFLVGQIWVSHHAMWRHIERVDRFVKLALLLHLLVTCLIPLASQMLAEYLLRSPVDQQTSAAVYAGVALASALSFNAIWLVARYRGLVAKDLSPRALRAMTLRWASAPILYAIALAVAFVSPRVSVALYIALIVPYLLPGPEDRVSDTAD